MYRNNVLFSLHGITFCIWNINLLIFQVYSVFHCEVTCLFKFLL